MNQPATKANDLSRNDWQLSELQAIYQQPFMDLLMQAQQVHRQHFQANRVQTSTLLSIKTGACPEDCAYCPQSGHYNTGLSKEQLMQVEQVVNEAKAALDTGATRFCMGAAWRSPREKDMPAVLEMVKQVKALGLETCMTLGMLNEQQAEQLANAGLDYYNHNLDTSENYYDSIISTRTFSDRLKTLEHVRNANINVCAGGILGLGESPSDRLGLIQALANLPEHPQSVPINQLVAVPGTPLEDAEPCEELDFIRIIALARIVMPRTYVRLSAGRETMTDSMQALCFMAGANSIFYGEKLLTTENPELERDQQLLAKLGILQEQKAGDSALKSESKPLYYPA